MVVENFSIEVPDASIIEYRGIAINAQKSLEYQHRIMGKSSLSLPAWDIMLHIFTNDLRSDRKICDGYIANIFNQDTIKRCIDILIDNKFVSFCDESRKIITLTQAGMDCVIICLKELLSGGIYTI